MNSFTFSFSLSEFSTSCSNGCSFPSINSVCRLTKPFGGTSSLSCPFSLFSPVSKNSDASASSAELLSVNSTPALTFCVTESFTSSVFSVGLSEILPDATGSLRLEDDSVDWDSSDNDFSASSSNTSTRVLRLIIPVSDHSPICSESTLSRAEMLSFCEVSSSVFPRASLICSPAFCTKALSSCSFLEADTLLTDTSFFISSLTFFTSASTLTLPSSSSNPSTACVNFASASTSRTPSISSSSRLTLFVSPLPPR